MTVTVERSPQRIFPIEAYEAAGCRVVEPHSWTVAPLDAVVVGLKELPEEPGELRHRHVFFGHAYKGQPGAETLLRRFVAGGGALFDLEYLVDDNGRRLAAFGYWAGYVGAALAVLHHRGRLTAPLQPTSKDELDALLQPRPDDAQFSSIVIGALGRSGRGARAALDGGRARPHVLGPRRDPRPGPTGPAGPRVDGQLRAQHRPRHPLPHRQGPGRAAPEPAHGVRCDLRRRLPVQRSSGVRHGHRLDGPRTPPPRTSPPSTSSPSTTCRPCCPRRRARTSRPC